MVIVDRVYCYLVAAVLRTPSRDEVFGAAAWTLAAVAAVHVVGLAALIAKIAGYDLLDVIGKSGVVALTVLIATVCVVPYSWQGRERALHVATGDPRSRRSAVIGFVIIGWTAIFPFVVGAFLIEWSNLSR